MIEWAVFYGNGTVVTDEDAAPWKIPRVDVQLTVWRSEVTGWNWEKSDRGVWVWRADLGYWLGLQNEAGWWDYLYHHDGQTVSIFGRLMGDEEFAQILRDAEAVMGEPKSAWRRREKPW